MCVNQSQNDHFSIEGGQSHGIWHGETFLEMSPPLSLDSCAWINEIAEILWGLIPDALLVFMLLALVVFRLFYLGAYRAQGFLQIPCGLFAVGAVESDGVDLDFAGWGDGDFNGGFHKLVRVSLMEPLGWVLRTAV